ncbi:MAG: nucleotidyl transferase [Desulfotalea sp.]|nr:MAG: nucleotidyl transferase [Desulfotalea sp.]
MKKNTHYSSYIDEPVRTALLLAAGTGSRLAPLTDSTPKCLVTVNEISILERLISSLQAHNFTRLVIVIGYQGECIRNYLGNKKGGMEITYITSSVYRTTNNIYSLWLARNVIDEPFLLVESDLVFDTEMLTDMLAPDRIAVAKMEPWMNGTTVTVNTHGEVEAFHGTTNTPGNNHFKTVNIYSLSMKTWDLVKQRLDQYIAGDEVNGYYETVFADMVKEGCLSFTPVFFDTRGWYEIDTLTDLREAELICSPWKQDSTFSAYPSFGSLVTAKDSLNVKVSSSMAPRANITQ